MLAPDWRRPLQWLPALAAYIVAAPLDGDTCLALDARAVGLTGPQVGALVERACDYVSEGRDFAEVLLAPGAEREQPQAVVRSAGELVERLGLNVSEVEQTWTSLFGHAQWAKALVDDLQAQVDKALFEAARPVDLDGEPLVTVRIPTFGSTELLIERAIPSVLGGAYQNIELLVCSDGPQPHAREAVEHVKDPRVRYIEVPERPRYPTIPFSFWRVAGTSAVNRLIDEARGDLIAPLDHDDSFTTEHIPVLLQALRRGQADFAYGQAMTEEYNDTWSLVGHPQLQQGGIVHATVLYTRRLAHMRYDPEAWIWDDPGDWNLWRRIRATGARIAYAPTPVSVHFKEHSSIAGRTISVEESADIGMRDLHECGNAGALLGIASRTDGAVGLGSSSSSPARRRASGRRLAVVDRAFPSPGAASDEAATLLEHHPELVFFSKLRTHEPWPRPVYGLNELVRIANSHGLSDVYVRDGGDLATEVASALKGSRVKVHRALANGHAEPVHTGFFAFRPRAPKPRFRFVCAVTDPVVQTAIHALEGLDSRFELHIAGAVQNLEGTPPRGLVFHGALDRAGLRDLYYACDAYVAARPDRTACEASASGLALIATTPQGGPLEAGRDFLSVRDDAQALGASLTALADQHEARDELARAGAERVREEMDIDRIVAAKLAAMGF